MEKKKKKLSSSENFLMEKKNNFLMEKKIIAPNASDWWLNRRAFNISAQCLRRKIHVILPNKLRITPRSLWFMEYSLSSFIRPLSAVYSPRAGGGERREGAKGGNNVRATEFLPSSSLRGCAETLKPFYIPRPR